MPYPSEDLCFWRATEKTLPARTPRCDIWDFWREIQAKPDQFRINATALLWSQGIRTKNRPLAVAKVKLSELAILP
jgi:hypothetical protein